MPKAAAQARERSSALTVNGAGDLQSDLQHGLAELEAKLKADLKAELRSGFEMLQEEWGSPLDDKSKLRRGLRAELQVQLFMSTRGLEDQEPVPAPVVPHGPYCGTPVGSESNDSHPVMEPNLENKHAGGSPATNILSMEAPDPLHGSIDSCALGGAVECDSEADPIQGTSEQTGQQITRVADIRNILDEPWWETQYGTGRLASIRRVCAGLVHSNFYFDIVMGLVIIVNSICVALEIQWDLDKDTEKLEVTNVSEHLFLVIFVIELGIYILADGWRVRADGWFMFDALLVGVGVLSSWIIDPIMLYAGFLGVSGTLSKVLILRVLRLLRLIRALKLVEGFQELWKLADGLIHSLRVVCSAALLTAITVYIFAGIGVEIITQNETLQGDVVCQEIVDVHFRSLPITMLTLVQFANADSIAGVYGPLIAQDPVLGLYFGVVWLVVTVCIMNSVTAVIVDRAISQSHVDREMEMFQKRKMLKDLAPAVKHIFRALDNDGNGTLQLSEVKRGLEKLEKHPTVPAELQKLLKADKLNDLFSFLDTDASGDVDENEFLEGVFHLALETVPLETTQMLQLLKTNGEYLHTIKDMVRLGACKSSQMFLSRDHSKGSDVLDVEIALPSVEISSSSYSERKFLRAHTFNVRLDTPLRQDYPKDSVISHPCYRDRKTRLP